MPHSVCSINIILVSIISMTCLGLVPCLDSLPYSAMVQTKVLTNNLNSVYFAC